MKAYAVVENCQEGLVHECGYAAILGMFLIDPANANMALVKAEKCLHDYYVAATADGGPEQEAEFCRDGDTGMVSASWIKPENDTVHFLEIREVDITE